MLSFGTTLGAHFFLRCLRILCSHSPVPRGRTRALALGDLIGGCWANVELIAAFYRCVPQRLVSFWCIQCGSCAWASHRCVLSACEVRRSEAAGVVARHRLRASRVIASGADVRCTVTDAVSDAVSCVSVSRR